tara:strand:- start:385 stop:1227 length:843 start_codon:yes stop_codon:yes gene_type:complete
MKRLFVLLLLSFTFSQDEYLVTIPATSYTEWIYYSFETHSIVEIENPENSLDWDIGLQRKHIRSNSGLAGIGLGGGYVDSTQTWIDQWDNMTELPSDMYWHTDETFYDFYDINTHTYVEGIENPALRSWGWFDNYFQLVPTNYVMFVKCANGEDIIKFWAYDYYDNGGGNISIRYQTGFSESQLSNSSINNSEFKLSSAYPNPFNPSTTFLLNMPVSDYVSIKVYNLMGQVVDVISDEFLQAKEHSFTWSPNGDGVSSGLYLIKAESSSNVDIQQVLLIK